MKKIFSLIILLTVCLSLNAIEIKRLSTFTIWGMVELREAPGFEEPVKYRTLNHENGLKVRAVEIGKKDTEILEKDIKAEGLWYRIITTAPVWSEEWDFIQRGNEFWVFVSEDTMISDYEE